MDSHSELQTLPPEVDRVLILANPKAGAASGKNSVDALVAALGRHRLAAEIVPHPDELACRAAAVQSSGRLRALVGAGGDGTVAELINRAPPGIPITTLPLGTENLLAKYLDMPRAPSEVAEVIAAGAVVRHDAGRAGDRLFALMVSCGFDAEVVRRLHENRQGNISHWSYFKPIWQTIRSYEYPELRVYCDPGGPGGERSAPAGGTLIRARFAFVFNIPRYAFGFQFAPDALGDDGLLDVCTFRYGSFGHGLWYLMNVILQRHPRIADCTMLRARRVRIEADEAVPYNLDGDHCGYLPLDIEIEPDRLTLLVPPGWAERRYSHSSVRKRTG
jgi:diacylglycerol kinase (ATP)